MSRYVRHFGELRFRDLYAEGLSHGEELTIEATGLLENIPKILRIAFSWPRAYRFADESYMLILADELYREAASGQNHWFFEVEDSEYLAWFNTQSFDAYRSQGMRHFLVATGSEIIDVIDSALPRIDISDSEPLR